MRSPWPSNIQGIAKSPGIERYPPFVQYKAYARTPGVEVREKRSRVIYPLQG